jgi:hypothetical protein
MGEVRNANTMWVRKTRKEKQVGSSRCSVGDNNKRILKQIRREGVDWVALTQDRWRPLVNTVCTFGFRKTLTTY